MKTVPFFTVSSAQISQHPGSFIRARGNFNGTTALRWLMFFDNNGQPAPSNGTAPAFAATPLYPGSASQPTPIFVDTEYQNFEFANGLYVAVSTTQTTLTQSTDTMDLSADLSDPEEPSGTSFAGDTTTAVDSLQVYANGGASSARDLFAITATNTNVASTLYLQLFTGGAPSAGQVPALQWAFTPNQTRVLKFGRQGLHMVTGANGSQTYGVYLYGSTTAGSFTATTGGQWNIQAEYGQTQNG